MSSVLLRYVLRPIVFVVWSVVGPVCKFLFSGLDRRLARKHRNQLIQEAKAEAPFLFAGDHHIQPADRDGPTGFDYACFVVKRGNLRYKLSRCRGDVDLKLEFADQPNGWHDLGTILHVLTGEPRQLGYYTVYGALTALRDNLDRIEAFGDPSQRSDLLAKLAGIRRDDEILMRQTEWEINRR